ncbi:MAG: chain length-determining protein, partial [Zoogloea sp.]|nr:chain length-determining protein [Zoogloea sp.]
PKRILLLPAALVLALVAGVLASLVASRARPTFFDVRSLREVSGMPVLGTVSLVVGDALKYKERRDRLRFFTLLGALVSAYAGGTSALFLLSR